MTPLRFEQVGPIYRRCPHCGRALPNAEPAAGRHVESCSRTYARYLEDRARLEGERQAAAGEPS